MAVQRTGGPTNPAMADALLKAGAGKPGSAVSQSRHRDVEEPQSDRSGEAAIQSQQPASTAEEAPVAAAPVAELPVAEPQTTQKAQVKETTRMTNGTQEFSEARRDGNESRQTHFLGEAGNNFQRPMSRFFGDARATALANKLRELATANIREQKTSRFNIALLPGDETGLPVSVILVLQSTNAGGNLIGSIYSLLVESGDLRLPTLAEKTEAGTTVDIPATLADVVNSKEYWTLATRYATKLVGEGRWTEAGSERIPAGNQENEEFYLNTILFHATRATFSNLSNYVKLSNEAPYTVAKRNTSEQLSARLNTSAEQFFTPSGEPIRSDVVIQMNSGRSGESFVTNERSISEVRGYIEPVYAQPAPAVNGVATENQPFFPMFVMTNLDSGYDALDREMVLLALATGTLIETNDAWAGQFRPRFKPRAQTVNRGKGTEDDVDLRDVGALGYAVGEGKRVSTREESFGTHFSDYMRQVFRSRVVYAIDIPEMGGNSWAFDVFRAAATGNGNAVEAIIKAADNLTGGNFSTLWRQAGGTKIIDNVGVRIANGYYIRDNGEKRDLRDVDQLAVMNVFGKSSTKTVLDYADTFSPSKGSANIRLHQRLTIADEVIGGRMHITGMSSRHIFQPLFMQILAQACSAAGLTVQPNNIASAGLGGGAIMGGFDYGAYAGNGAGSSIFGQRSTNAPGVAAGGVGRNTWA